MALTNEEATGDAIEANSKAGNPRTRGARIASPAAPTIVCRVVSGGQPGISAHVVRFGLCPAESHPVLIEIHAARFGELNQVIEPPVSQCDRIHDEEQCPRLW